MKTVSGDEEIFCCYGYAIDLLIQLAKATKVTYDLHLSADNKVGSYNQVRLYCLSIKLTQATVYLRLHKNGAILVHNI